MPRRIVIVGAGECGARAALALRKNGYDGGLTLIGEEAHAPYERPPLSKEALTGVDEPRPKTILAAEAAAADGIDLATSRRVVAIDRGTRSLILNDSGTVGYDRLLLATGAVPRRLPIDGADGPSVRYLRTFDDAVAIRRALVPGLRIVVIGGGFIGLELAASANRRGAEVVVIESLPRLLSRGVPEEIAAVVAARHRQAGVDVRCEEAIAGIEHKADGVSIALRGGATVAADLVVVGIGVVPAAHLADQAGLDIVNGVAVDRYLRTSDPDIFAAGDCSSFPLDIYGGRRVRLESWRSAVDHAGFAAMNLLGGSEAVSSVPWFWSDQYDLTLQVAGLADEGEVSVRREIGGGAFIVFRLAADGRLVAASGIGPANAVAKDIRIAEMLIGRKACPSPAVLSSPDAKLKSLLAA